MHKENIHILISGGGTGGHIYPAIAIANELKTRHPKAKFLFVGAKDRMEMEKVPAAGYAIRGLWISGVQRKLTIDNLSFPFKLLSSLWKSKAIVKNFKPDVVIGTGGFASGPVLYEASRKQIPTLIQEQNSYPGITNKLLAKKASVICVAYDHLQRFFPKHKIHKTGNPVRQDLLSIAHKRTGAQEAFGLDPKKKTILVIGGSLGARNLNLMVENSLDWMAGQAIQLVWQTGKLYYDRYEKYNAKEGMRVQAFLNEMEDAYAAADIIISRAGASSISELCIVGKPTVFVPSPNVSEDHQTKNALAVVGENAAILLREREQSLFQTKLENLLEDENLQRTLSENIQKLALPNATKDIVDLVEELIENKKRKTQNERT